MNALNVRPVPPIESAHALQYYIRKLGDFSDLDTPLIKQIEAKGPVTLLLAPLSAGEQVSQTDKPRKLVLVHDLLEVTEDLSASCRGVRRSVKLYQNGIELRRRAQLTRVKGGPGEVRLEGEMVRVSRNIACKSRVAVEKSDELQLNSGQIGRTHSFSSQVGEVGLQ